LVEPSRELWRAIDGLYDVVIIPNSYIGTYIHAALSGAGTFVSRTPWLSDLRISPAVVGAPNYCYDYAGMSLDEKVRETWAALSCPILFNSEQQRAQFAKTASAYIRPSVVMEMAKAYVVPIGMDVDRFTAADKSAGRIKWRWAGRLDSYKGADDALEIVDSAFRLGCDIEMTVTTFGTYVDSDYTRDLLAKYPHVKQDHNLSADGYVAALQDAHLFVCCSHIESFGMVAFESLLCGQVGVLLDKPWRKGIFPEEYPFVAKTKVEAVAMVKWICNNYAEAKKMIEWVIPWILAKHGPDVIAERLEDCLREICKRKLESDRKVLSKSPVWNFIETFDGDEISFAEVYEFTGLKPTRSVRRMTERGIRKILESFGFVSVSGDLFRRSI
jgi:glycosyltransferase involved in cell wall biosynthesis